MTQVSNEALQRLIDRAAIQDCMARYAQGVDRHDLDLMRTAYHTDAFDDHVTFKGDVDHLVEWLEDRFKDVDNSMHFLGQSLIEFAGPDLALVETYFASVRLRPPEIGERHIAGPKDMMRREGWGRYVDRFERRDGEWRVARRIVVIEAAFTSHAIGGARTYPSNWGQRNRSDALFTARAEIMGQKAG